MLLCFIQLMFFPVNTKKLYNICTMLDQRLRRWANVVQMLYKCFVFTGLDPLSATAITEWLYILSNNISILRIPIQFRTA